MCPVNRPGLPSALVCLLFITPGATGVAFLKSDHVTLVTCTHESTNLVLLKLSEAGEKGSIAAYNRYEKSCLGNFTLVACSIDREVRVKAVVTDAAEGLFITCNAEVKQDKRVVHKYIGAVNITTPDRTSGWTETTQGVQAQVIRSTTVESPLCGELHPSQRRQNTSTASDTSTEASGKQEKIVTSDTLGLSTKGHPGQPETTETRGPSTGSGGQQDTPKVPVMSPLTVWMLGGVSAGLVLLAGLAVLLALNIRREKQNSHKLLYRIPEALPLHNSRLPVDSNRYLPAVPPCSPFNTYGGESNRQTPSSLTSPYRYRHLAVRRHAALANYGDVYLTPSPPSSCFTTPLTLQSCGRTTDQWPQPGNPYMEPRLSPEEVTAEGARAGQRTRKFEESGDDLDEVNLYSTVTEVTAELGESVDSTSVKSFM